MSTYELLKQAIQEKKQVVATYKGYEREFCPHILGSTDFKRNVSVYQFAGSSSSGLPDKRGWRCLNVNQFSEVSLREGEWHSVDYNPHSRSCVKWVDVAVSIDT